MERVKSYIMKSEFTRSNDFHKSLLKVFEGEFMGRKIMKQLNIFNGTMARDYRFNPYPLPREKNLCQISHFVGVNINTGTIDVVMFLIGKQIIDFLSMQDLYNPLFCGIPFLLRAGKKNKRYLLMALLLNKRKQLYLLLILVRYIG